MERRKEGRKEGRKERKKDRQTERKKAGNLTFSGYVIFDFAHL